MRAKVRPNMPQPCTSAVHVCTAPACRKPAVSTCFSRSCPFVAVVEEKKDEAVEAQKEKAKEQIDDPVLSSTLAAQL